MPGIILMATLKVIGTEHHDHQCKGRMRFDALTHPVKAVPSGLEPVIPSGASPIQTILNDANALPVGDELGLQHAWPSLLKRQTPAGVWNDAPTQRITVSETLLHAVFR